MRKIQTFPVKKIPDTEIGQLPLFKFADLLQNNTMVQL